LLLFSFVIKFLVAPEGIGLMYAVNYWLVETLINNNYIPSTSGLRCNFITISAPLKDVKIVLRDSKRIFPVSLKMWSI
jgi:hypothetical protein